MTDFGSEMKKAPGGVRPPGAFFPALRLLADDRRLHRPENTEQLAFFLFGNLELVQRLDQVLDQGVELCVVDAHAGMRRLHVAPRISARPAGAGADLLYQQPFQARYIGLGEELVDAVVGSDIADEIVDHGNERALTTEPIVKRLLLHWLLAHVLAVG